MLPSITPLLSLRIGSIPVVADIYNLMHIPVVIHSSLSGSANEQHVRKVGANAYVSKFEASELANVMRGALAHAA